jgi:hypothetical protein
LADYSLTLPSRIIGTNKVQARVTERGELITSAIEHSQPYYVELGVDAQIYNVIPGVVGWRFVITSIIIGADRNVSIDCTVHIYESLSADGTTERDIWRGDINKGETLPLIGLDIITRPTRWVNATTDDDDVDLTILGYYVVV